MNIHHKINGKAQRVWYRKNTNGMNVEKRRAESPFWPFNGPFCTSAQRLERKLYWSDDSTGPKETR